MENSKFTSREILFSLLPLLFSFFSSSFLLQLILFVRSDLLNCFDELKCYSPYES